MGRRKNKDGFHLKYCASGRVEELQQLANDFPFMKDKTKAFYKYIETFSSIVERCKHADTEFVGTPVSMLSKNIGGDSMQATRILKDLVDHKFLIRDKSKFKIGVKAWDYKPANQKVDVVLLIRKFIDDSTDERLDDCITTGLYGDAILYRAVVYKLELDNDIYDYLSNNYTLYCNASYDTRFVHPDLTTANEHTSFVHEHTRFVQQQVCRLDQQQLASVPYQIIGSIPTKLVSVYKLLAKKFRISRPHKNSRVYTNITNLGREFRPSLRLNGKPLIGFDIANSQPLIASILFRKYSLNEYGYIKDDVSEYQKMCEAGKFYEYFMELNSIDINCEIARTKFKGDFFGSVFYTKEVEKDNLLKSQFRAKYPTCYDAIFLIKGGLYSKEYKEFPALMTELETAIMFDTNIELIKEGYDVVNIFDSLYSDSDEAIEKAKEKVIAKFKECGITPTLKDISYRAKIITMNKGIKQTTEANSEPISDEQLGIETWDEYRKRETMWKGQNQLHREYEALVMAASKRKRLGGQA